MSLSQLCTASQKLDSCESNKYGKDPHLERIAQLEQLVVRLTLELEILKKASSIRTTIPAGWRKHLRKQSPRFTIVIMGYSIFRIDIFLFLEMQG